MKTILTIFGATGNLMQIKLVPALVHLFQNGHLKDDTEILCVSRRDYDDEQYFEHLLENIPDKIDITPIKKHLHYVKVDIANIKDYLDLKKRIDAIGGIESQNLFYLAVSPELFVDIAKGISEAGLVKKGDPLDRIVFEKPFGTDFESARAINLALSTYFNESQIYRIDHYLGKDMIQNILVMRFGNIVLENNWNRETIEKVDIVVKEKSGIGNRANYYDHSGALRDMVQSHLLQMLALIAMDEPDSLSPQDIRKAKVEILRKTKIDQQGSFFGQYLGYLDEPGMPEGSMTETFVQLKAFVDTPRFKGVPFYLTTGKHLSEKNAYIVVHFKEHSSSSKLWPDRPRFTNRLVIGVSEYEGVRIEMNFKTPGLDDAVQETSLDYCHSCQKIGNNPEAYEKLLKDFIDQLQTLFASWDEIEASWNVVDQAKPEGLKPFIYRDEDDLLEILSKGKAGGSLDS